MWYLYIIECADKTLYTGITTDLERRIEEHNYSSKAAKYTKIRRPVKMVYSEEFEDRSTAAKAEAAMKSYSKAEKLRIINSQ